MLLLPCESSSLFLRYLTCFLFEKLASYKSSHPVFTRPTSAVTLWREKLPKTQNRLKREEVVSKSYQVFGWSGVTAIHSIRHICNLSIDQITRLTCSAPCHSTWFLHSQIRGDEKCHRLGDRIGAGPLAKGSMHAGCWMRTRLHFVARVGPRHAHLVIMFEAFCQIPGIDIAIHYLCNFTKQRFSYQILDTLQKRQRPNAKVPLDQSS